MDIRDKYNRERLVKRFDIGAVVVKQQKSSIETIKYIVIGCTAKLIDSIVESKTLDKTIYSILIEQQLINVNTDVKEVLYWGNLKDFKQYSDLVYKFPLRRQDLKEGKEPHYRLYTRTAEQQKNTMWLINICSTSQQSWLSVIEKVGSSYGLLLKIKIRNDTNSIKS